MKKLIPIIVLLLALLLAPAAFARPLEDGGDPCLHPDPTVEPTVEPTCTEAGWGVYTCELCGETWEGEIAPLGHDFGAWTKLNDDEHQRTCSRCPVSEKESHAWDEGKETLAPTCLADGEKTYTCDVCEGTKTEAVPALGHDFGAWTKLDDNEHQRTCSRCETVEKESHAWDGGKETLAPACVTDGEMTFTCPVCNGTKTEPVAPLGHIERVEGAAAPACTTPGSTGKTMCARCGETLKAAETIPALGHDEKTVPGVPATCTATGTSDAVTCLRCGKTLVASEPTPALGHDFTGYLVTKAPTWREEGRETNSCTRCDFSHSRRLPKRTHLAYSACPRGDADLDGTVTAADARYILRLAVDYDDGFDADQVKKADVTESDGVTAADARAALLISVGIDPFTPTLLPGYKFKGYTTKNYILAEKDGVTYVVSNYGYTLIANKTYSLPASYAPGDLTPECRAAFDRLVNGASASGVGLYVVSGYRSYWLQQDLYNRYCAADGKAAADTYSARPGHSEHQTGLAMDVNSLSASFAYTREGIWLANHAHEYGFVIRYGATKQAQTGYVYEPWHIRYLGIDLAKAVYASGLCLEEFFGITSAYS